MKSENNLNSSLYTISLNYPYSKTDRMSAMILTFLIVIVTHSYHAVSVVVTSITKDLIRNHDNLSTHSPLNNQTNKDWVIFNAAYTVYYKENIQQPQPAMEVDEVIVQVVSLNADKLIMDLLYLTFKQQRGHIYLKPMLHTVLFKGL